MKFNQFTVFHEENKKEFKKYDLAFQDFRDQSNINFENIKNTLLNLMKNDLQTSNVKKKNFFLFELQNHFSE